MNEEAWDEAEFQTRYSLFSDQINHAFSSKSPPLRRRILEAVISQHVAIVQYVNLLSRTSEGDRAVQPACRTKASLFTPTHQS